MPRAGRPWHRCNRRFDCASTGQRVEEFLIEALWPRADQPLDLAAILDDDQRGYALDAQLSYGARLLAVVLQVAQWLGFWLTESGLLFEQRDTAAPLSERWQALAREKLADVEQLIRHAREVRQTLIGGLRCGCANLHECIDCVLRRCA